LKFSFRQTGAIIEKFSSAEDLYGKNKNFLNRFKVEAAIGKGSYIQFTWEVKK